MLDRLTFRARVVSLSAINLFFVLVLAGIAYFGIAGLNRMLDQQAESANLLRSEVTADMYHDGIKAHVMAALVAASEGAPDVATKSELLDGFRDDSAAFREEMNKLDDNPLMGQQGRDLLSQAKIDVARYLEEAGAIVDLALTNHAAARARIPGFMTQFETLEKSLSQLADAIEADIATVKTQGDEAGFRAYAGLSVTTLAGTAFLVGLSAFIVGSVFRQLGGDPALLQGAAQQIAKGQFDFDLPLRAGDASSVMAQVDQMRQSLKESYQQLDRRLREVELMREVEKKQAAENTRIRTALDNVSMPVMISDTDSVIIYVNKSMEAGMLAAATDIRKSIPDFSASRLIGSSTSQFLGGGQATKKASEPEVLETLNKTFRAPLKIGSRRYMITANPVLTPQGERLGSVMEWEDRTAQIEAERAIVQVVQEAGAGRMSDRIDLQRLPEGFLREAGKGINQILDAVSAPINGLEGLLEAMSKGDLTQQVTGDYQGAFGRLRDHANASLRNMAQIVSAIQEATGSINTASKEIAIGNQDLSQRTEEQASSLEETASSMEELASTTRMNADNARQANQMAVAASDIAMRGGEIVQRVVGTMSDINTSSRKIVDIISIIDSIAFQTNILALNAAVEAARAGEQGRGFAVVAGEVRNLAQRSATAAKEIKGLIDDSVDKVEGGARLTEEAGRTMDEIVVAVKRVTDIMSEIAASSTEQSAGIEQVNQAITQMDDATQQNAALVEQSAAAAESLEEQAALLADTVAKFKIRSDRQRLDPSSDRLRSVSPKRNTCRMAQPVTARPKPALVAGGREREWEEF
jgi:methyl-accepting chemotaxis protein